MSQITKIEGIGPSYAEKLKAEGISTTEKLLEQGAAPAGRKAIIESTGISKNLILRWINMADLFRIKGVGEEFADLLEAAGVDTVPELAQRNAKNLSEKMDAVNAEKNLVRTVPSQSSVEAWVKQDKESPRIITY